MLQVGSSSSDRTASALTLVGRYLRESPTGGVFRMRIGDVASAAGKGLFAGAVGTAAMTISSTIEQKARGREGSTTPGDAAQEVLPIEADEGEEQRLSNLVHWAYGTAWGVPRGLLSAFGLRGPAATAVHFAAVWGGALIMLPKLRVVPPIREWGAKEVAIDAGHHVVYATVAGTAYAWLDRRSRAPTQTRGGAVARVRRLAGQLAA